VLPTTYLDAASAVPLHPVAREALLAAQDDGWADPGRLYGAGRRARILVDAARETIAECLGTRPDEITFCASGTQAVHLAVLGALGARRRSGDTLVHSAVEHSSVLHAARRHGHTEIMPVDRSGRVELSTVEGAIGRPGVALVALMSANHEVGTRQPVMETARLCADRGLPLFVDAAQTAGWEPLPEGWSYASASAHKWGGPSGVGVLAIRTGARWSNPLPAGDGGSDRVPGALDIPAIVAAAAGLRAVRAEAAALEERLRPLVDRMRQAIPARIPDVEVVGDPVRRLPHILTFSCLYAEGEALLRSLDQRGFAVSSGSSCTSSTVEPSHVLVAMGALTHGNVRVSLHRGTTEDDVERFLDALPEVVAELRRDAGADAL
jgi:cysteine desulfurase